MKAEYASAIARRTGLHRHAPHPRRRMRPHATDGNAVVGSDRGILSLIGIRNSRNGRSILFALRFGSTVLSPDQVRDLQELARAQGWRPPWFGNDHAEVDSQDPVTLIEVEWPAPSLPSAGHVAEAYGVLVERVGAFVNHLSGRCESCEQESVPELVTRNGVLGRYCPRCRVRVKSNADRARAVKREEERFRGQSMNLPLGVVAGLVTAVALGWAGGYASANWLETGGGRFVVWFFVSCLFVLPVALVTSKVAGGETEGVFLASTGLVMLSVITAGVSYFWFLAGKEDVRAGIDRWQGAWDQFLMGAWGYVLFGIIMLALVFYSGVATSMLDHVEEPVFEPVALEHDTVPFPESRTR